MDTNIQNLIRLAFLGWIVSFALHVLSIFNITILTDIIPMVLFILLIFLYLQVSRRLRELVRGSEDEPIWKKLYVNTPEWLKWISGSLALYAAINFILFYIKTDAPGWVSFNVPAAKIRIVSGFLMALFSLAFAAMYSLSTVHDKDTESGNNYSE